MIEGRDEILDAAVKYLQKNLKDEIGLTYLRYRLCCSRSGQNLSRVYNNGECPSPALRSRRSVVAHPSHELRLHGWLEQTRPCVCVLTDGAGRSGEPRLTRTTEVLARAGATQGAIYGRFTDLEVYSAILNGDGELSRVVEELAEMFVEKRTIMSLVMLPRVIA